LIKLFLLISDWQRLPTDCFSGVAQCFGAASLNHHLQNILRFFLQPLRRRLSVIEPMTMHKTANGRAISSRHEVAAKEGRCEAITD
jgi:hypothetical protein